MSSKEKKRSIGYWVSTGFVVFVMGISGGLAISHGAPFRKALSHFGYPSYFSNLLGVGKLVGICMLLAPGLPRMKEWAYVAFGITVLSACYSHYSSGNGFMSLNHL